MAAAEFQTPALKEYPVIPILQRDAMQHVRPFVASEKMNEALGFPGKLVENWRERAIARMGELLPAAVFPAPPPGPETPPARRYLWQHGGKVYLLMAARAQVAGGPQTVLLQAALDVSREEAFIAAYREKLLLVLACGIVLAAAAGYAVARRGLRPLHRITDVAERITATRLHAHIEPARWPQELRSLARAFNDMLDRLGDSFSRLAQFSADLAHELRTPINNLMGEAEVALKLGEYRKLKPGPLEEFVFFDHPSGYNRILMAMKWKAENLQLFEKSTKP